MTDSTDRKISLMKHKVVNSFTILVNANTGGVGM